MLLNIYRVCDGCWFELTIQSFDYHYLIFLYIYGIKRMKKNVLNKKGLKGHIFIIRVRARQRNSLDTICICNNSTFGDNNNNRHCIF